MKELMTMANDNDNTSDDHHKGYSLFSDVENKTLRAFNQYNILSNMHENKLDALGTEYINALPMEDRYRLMMMVQYIKLKGLEETKREIFIKAA